MWFIRAKERGGQSRPSSCGLCPCLHPGCCCWALLVTGARVPLSTHPYPRTLSPPLIRSVAVPGSGGAGPKQRSALVLAEAHTVPVSPLLPPGRGPRVPVPVSAASPCPGRGHLSPRRASALCLHRVRVIAEDVQQERSPGWSLWTLVTHLQAEQLVIHPALSPAFQPVCDHPLVQPSKHSILPWT